MLGGLSPTAHSREEHGRSWPGRLRPIRAVRHFAACYPSGSADERASEDGADILRLCEKPLPTKRGS